MLERNTDWLCRAFGKTIITIKISGKICAKQQKCPQNMISNIPHIILRKYVLNAELSGLCALFGQNLKMCLKSAVARDCKDHIFHPRHQKAIDSLHYCVCCCHLVQIFFWMRPIFVAFKRRSGQRAESRRLNRSTLSPRSRGKGESKGGEKE